MIAPVYNSYRFTTAGKVLVAEVSDFGTYIDGLLYPGATADVGFRIKSERTGKTEAFYFDRFVVAVVENDELVMMVYKPVDTALMAAGVEVHIFND